MKYGRARLTAGSAALLVALATVALAAPPPSGGLRVWVLDRGQVRSVGAGAGAGSGGAGGADRGAEEPSFPLGSLVKPFLAEAWASAHSGEPTPRFRCAGGAQCWRPAGHGELGLARAVEVSCNAYFRALAGATPRELAEQTLRGAGLSVIAPLTPDAALGLAPVSAGAGSVRATPERLLAAYAALAREPWARGEGVRQEVLAGLAAAARTGTAAALGARGLRAKTGTVPALDGAALATSGFTLAFDESGWAVLALLPRGTGREAAAALAARLPELRPGAVARARAAPPRARAEAGAGAGGGAIEPPRTSWRWDPASGEEPPAVRVALFGALGPRELSARNLGSAPAPGPRGFVGPRGSVALAVGDALGPSLWELAVPSFRLRRVVSGSIILAAGRDGTLRPIAETSAADYVGGVLAAELPGGSSGEIRPALGAAVLRFLMRGARHEDAEVCDTTHCAWFVGRGPRVVWIDGRHPIELTAAGRTSGGERVLEPLSAPAWESAKRLARDDGPSQWTADCGGVPLSPHALWGNGDRRVWVCRRHGSTPRAPWSREWSRADLARVFGAPVRALALAEPDGVWTLRASLAGGDVRELRYDDAHRAIAEVLGWDALPSPASAIRRAADGYRVEGFGHGHRVGLCLAP